MKMKMYCVLDRATQVFSRPMFFMADGHALRSFTDEVNRAAEDNPFHAHPEDYEMYSLGDYNDSTGEFDTSRPVLFTRAQDVVIGKA